MNYNKFFTVMLSMFIVAIALTIFFLGKKDYGQYEIGDKNYHALLLKYEYLKGSEAGKAFTGKLKLYLEDGVITEKEYKSLTGKKSEMTVYTPPEYVALYEQSKNKLKEL